MKSNILIPPLSGWGRGSASWVATCCLVAVSAAAQPAISTHPKSQSVSLGANVTFSARASGAAPLSYQWRFNGSEIAGAVTNTLSLTNVTLSAAGDYLVVVSDATGLSSTSRVATLSVDPAFTKITVGGIVTDRGLFAGSSWADYNNDGFLDLLVSNFGGGGSFLYRNNRDGTFSRINASPIGTDPEHTIRCAWGDYDNDGFLDLVTLNGAASYSEANVLYHNNRDGTFSRMTAEAVGVLASTRGNCHGGAWRDFNHDGLLDLLVVDWSRKIVLYQNNPDGRFTKVVADPLVSFGSQSVGCAWGDYDNDGFLDLFVINGLFGPENNFLYRNEGNGTFTKITSGSLANDLGASSGIAWGDYDNDGFLDLFVANGVLGPAQLNSLYRNSGNGNSWVRIRCAGTVSNRAGFGAKVRIQATIAGQSRWQMRQIDGGDGASGGSIEAHFGLGDATLIDTLRIEWPSGIVQELRDVEPRRLLTVTEPARLQVLGAGVLRIQSWKGMAFAVQTSSDLRQWSSVGTVTNLTGTLEFSEPNEAGERQRFYCVVLMQAQRRAP